MKLMNIEKIGVTNNIAAQIEKENKMMTNVKAITTTSKEFADRVIGGTAGKAKVLLPRTKEVSMELAKCKFGMIKFEKSLEEFTRKLGRAIRVAFVIALVWYIATAVNPELAEKFPTLNQYFTYIIQFLEWIVRTVFGILGKAVEFLNGGNFSGMPRGIGEFFRWMASLTK